MDFVLNWLCRTTNPHPNLKPSSLVPDSPYNRRSMAEWSAVRAIFCCIFFDLERRRGLVLVASEVKREAGASVSTLLARYSDALLVCNPLFLCFFLCENELSFSARVRFGRKMQKKNKMFTVCHYLLCCPSPMLLIGTCI